MRLSGYLTFAFVFFFASVTFADFRVSLYDGLRQFRASVTPEAGADSMTLSASRNETVGLQAVLFNDSDQSIEDVKISAEGFSEITVRFYAAGAVRVDRGAKTIEFPEDAYFDLLRPAGWESIDKKSFRPYWIDFTIPPDAAPGVRHGKITFMTGNFSRSISVQIKVARPVLPVSPTLPLAFAFSRSWVEEFYGRKLTEDEVFQCYETMLEHRLGPVPMWGGRGDFYREKQLRYCAERGMNVFLVSVAGMDDPGLEKSLAAVKPMIDLLTEIDAAGRTYQFSFDEILMFPGWEKRLPWMRKSYERFHDAYPDIKRLATSWPDPRLDDFTDIYVVPVSQYKAEMSEKKAVWWYSVGNAHFEGSPDFRIDFPPILQRYFFLANWRAGIDGHLYWAAHREWPSNKNIARKDRVEDSWVPSYNNVNSGRRVDDCGAGNLFYPGGEKYASLPSVRAKYLREGVNDYEYLAQLRAATELLRKKKPTGWEAIEREAVSLLNFSPMLESSAVSECLDWRTQFNEAAELFGFTHAGRIEKAWVETTGGNRSSITYHPNAVHDGSTAAIRILPVEEETRLCQDVSVQKGCDHAAAVYIKTDDLKGKAFLRLEYLDTEKKMLECADSQQHVTGSTGARNFRKIEVRLTAAPPNAAFLRISLVAVLAPGYGPNDTEPLCKAFFDDVSATAGDRSLKIANPGFEEKYRFDKPQTDKYYAFRNRLVDCLDRTCALLGESGPFENARPGRDR